MEELDLKGQLLAAPQRMLRQKAYLPVMVVIEVPEVVR